MKNILIVDDTYDKTQVLVSLFKDNNIEFEYCCSSRDAITKIKDKQFDILVVDIQIPEEMGDDISENGGVDLIKFCTINENINKPYHIIGITSHHESYNKHIQYFKECGWPLLLGVDDHKLIKSLIDTKLKFSISQTENIDVAIVTALQKTELEAVLALPCDWVRDPVSDDVNVYHRGSLTTNDGKKLTIIATSCSRMGMAAAAATTMKVCSKFKPSRVIMTGIAAGVEGKTNFGDILVADPCWDWGSGKSTIVDDQPQHLSAPHQQSLSPRTRSIFQTISTERLFLDDIASAWPVEKRPASALNLIVGPVATGAVVLENPDTVRSIVSQHRETIGVEMEAYGFSYAASISYSPAPEAIAIKSVCDFANTDKNDDWQKYAAFSSAQLAFRYLQNYD